MSKTHPKDQAKKHNAKPNHNNHAKKEVKGAKAPQKSTAKTPAKAPVKQPILKSQSKPQKIVGKAVDFKKIEKKGDKKPDKKIDKNIDKKGDKAQKFNKDSFKFKNKPAKKDHKKETKPTKNNHKAKPFVKKGVPEKKHLPAKVASKHEPKHAPIAPAKGGKGAKASKVVAKAVEVKIEKNEKKGKAQAADKKLAPVVKITPPQEVLAPVEKKKGKEPAPEVAEEAEQMVITEEAILKELLYGLKVDTILKNDSDECSEKKCDNPATTLGYCRYHYIKNWNDVKKKRVVLEGGALQKLIEVLLGKFNAKTISEIIGDLSDDKAFTKVLKELDIDTDDEFEDAAEEEVDDDQDIAFETKSVVKLAFDED